MPYITIDIGTNLPFKPSCIELSGASDDARAAISKLISEIRSAKRIQVGSGDSSSFAEIEDGLAQEGSAIQIYASTNTDSFVRYFIDGFDQKLKRATNGSSSFEVIAQSITNTLPFTAEGFSGAVLTNNRNNRVIGVLLQFYQIQYPVVSIGPGNYYDYYQLRTHVTRRVLE